MGGCNPSRCPQCPGVGAKSPKPTDVNVAGPDMSSMDLDQLLRAGIAEAQIATVARVKRDHSLHLHRARALLMEALRRCGSQDPDLRMHLLAVLLKLGEDARSLSGLSSPNSPEAQHSEGQAAAASAVHQSSGKSTPVASPRRTPSEHSSEDAEVQSGGFDEKMKHHLLLDDDEPDELAPTVSPARLEQSPLEHGIDGESISAAPEPWDPASLLITRKTSPLSSVQECEDGASSGESSPRGNLKDHMALEEGTSACPDASSGALAEGSTIAKGSQGANAASASSTAHVSNELTSALAVLEQHLDDKRSSASGDVNVSPRLPASQPLSPQPAVAHGRNSTWPSALASSAAGCGTEGFAADVKESFARSRALQPQQASNAHLSSSTKRRHARSMVTSVEHGGADGRMDMERNYSPYMAPRHSRRQPSQSSSSGSQGPMSDSEGSVASKRAFPFAGTIEEEPAAYQAGRAKSSNKFEPPARSITHDDDQCDSGTASKACSRSPIGSYASGEELSPGNMRTPSLEAKTPNHSPPALEGAAPASSKRQEPALEKAIPSHGADVKNPLSQPEFRSRSSSVNASPCTESSQSRSSVASWSIGGGGMPPIGMSPFCEGASPFCEASGAISDLASPLGALRIPAPSDKISVRILNGVSGEEEVRFPVPVESSFSEQHFYSMLDRLCQKHAGQALCDMNWLSQAQPGARFQRRKCDLTMVEELFNEEGTSHRKGKMVLLLCTVPAMPPSELPANKVRLRNLMPSRVTYGAVQPVRLRLETSVLDTCSRYSVAFTHQWSNQTYSVEASLLANGRGVELSVPWQMLTAAGSNKDGLYDVHLVTDCSYKSENRRTLTVGSAESELSSSSTAMSTAQSSFVPLNRGGGIGRAA